MSCKDQISAYQLPLACLLIFAAHHVVKEDNDIKKAMEFLQQCDLIKIEDILPFFPNFVTIDHFKVSVNSFPTSRDTLSDSNRPDL